MAADAPEKKAPANSCCLAWRDAFSKLQEKRNALRQALKLIEPQLVKIQADNVSLKKACEEEKVQAESEKEELKNEISALKSEISQLKQKGDSNTQSRDEEMKVLQVCVLEKEKEISQLKEMLEKEKSSEASEKKNTGAEKNRVAEALTQKEESSVQNQNEEVKVLQTRVLEKEKEISQLKELLDKANILAESEKKNGEMEKKRAAEAWKYVKSEKAKADEERRLVNIETNKAEEYRLQLESLRKEADEAISKLVSEQLKSEEVNKKLEAEKQKVTKEKKRVSSEMAKAEVQRKLAEANRKQAEEEKCRAGNFAQQLESLCKEADDAKSKLVLEKLKFEEANKKLEAEKQKVTKERKRVASETAKAEEQRKLAEANKKQAEEEKRRADNFSQQLEALRKDADVAKSKLVFERRNLEEEKKKLEVGKEKVTKERKRLASEMAKAEEQRKIAEANRKQVEEEKRRADNMSQQLEEARQQIDKLQKEEKNSTLHLTQELEKAREKIDELQKQFTDLPSRKHLESAASVSCGKYLTAEVGELELLKKQLKFERMRVKHAKQVAKLEKHRNSILQQELGRLKLDFVQFSHRLEALDKCFPPDIKHIDDLIEGKVANRSNWQVEKGFGKRCCPAGDVSDPLVQTPQHIAPLLTLYGGNYNESISGIDSKDSKLESLLGGSSQKMLKSSAINSSSASFSDGQFVGSQGMGSLTVTTSSQLIEEQLNGNPTNSSISGEITRIRCDENHAVAEDSARSPLKICSYGCNHRQSRKRKRMLEVFESIESLHTMGGKLHLQIGEKLSDLHEMFSRQIDKSSDEVCYEISNLEDNTYLKHEQFHKKRKVSHGEAVNFQHLCISSEPNKIDEVGHVINEGVRLRQQISDRADNVMVNVQACAEGISDSVSGHELMESFEELANGDYMKLLDLDNPADEACYRAATEIPLSPTLPEIQFQGSGASDINKFGPPTGKGFDGGLTNVKRDLVSSCSFDVINVEISSNELNYNVSGSSQNSLLCKNQGPLDAGNLQNIDRSGNFGTVQAEKYHDHQVQGGQLQVAKLNLHGTADTVVKHPFERKLQPAQCNPRKYFVVCSNIEDKSVIYRIFHATKSCLDRCLLFAETEWVFQKILSALKMEEHLCSKEKACVLFSLLLLNFSTAAPGISGNFSDRGIVPCLDSFAAHAKSVMFEARSVVGELCLNELLGLIEEFIMDGRVITCCDVSSESQTKCNSKNNITLDGVNTMLSVETALDDQLVAGSIMLVSFCAATDQIGFICEASYNISRMRTCDPSLVLTVLHIFAHLSGKKFFTERKYSLTNTVLKSIVTYLEGKSSLAATTRFPSSASEVGAKFHPCAKCPFSEDAVSVDVALSLLLRKLQNYVESGISDVLFHEDQARQGCKELSCLVDRSNGTSGCLNSSVMPISQSESTVDSTLCHISDILSLVELLACNMGWDWICSTVTFRLLRILDSSIQETFAIPVVILLGQFGRLGVEACGYEDKDVESLRSKLSAFLWRDATIRGTLAIQITTIASLLALIPRDLEQIVQPNSDHPAVACQSVSVNSIRKWFSSLNKDQQALSYSLLQCSDVVTKQR